MSNFNDRARDALEDLVYFIDKESSLDMAEDPTMAHLVDQALTALNKAYNEEVRELLTLQPDMLDTGDYPDAWTRGVEGTKSAIRNRLTEERQ